jgi:methyl-accepting chemotaxis protein
MEELKKDGNIHWFNSITARIIKRTTILMFFVCGAFGGVSFYSAQQLMEQQMNNQANGNIALRYLIITIIFIFVGAISGYFISMDIKKPIRKIMDFARELEKYNLSYRIEIIRKDEIAATARALNKAAENFEKTMKTISEQTDSSYQSNIKTEKAFEKVNSQIEQISAATQEISASIEQTSAAIEEATAKSETVKSETTNINIKANKIQMKNIYLLIYFLFCNKKYCYYYGCYY